MRRPVSTSSAPAARRRRAIAWPRPPVAPVSRTVPPGEVHGGEDCHGGREAVQERVAADRADLAGGEEARRGRAGELLVEGVSVVVGRAEHRLAAAVAGEDERAGRRAAAERLAAQAERLAQVAVGRGGVARVQPHDRARLAPARRRSSVPASGSAPMRPRTRKSPCSYSGLPPSITIPSSSPLATSALLVGVERLDRLAQRVERGPARELADDVPVGRGDRQLRADRRRALRDARQHLDAVAGARRRRRRRTSSSPRKSAASPSRVRALAMPPRTGTPGARRDSSPSSAGRSGTSRGRGAG